MEKSELHQRMAQLGQRTAGLEGAVLRASRPEEYRRLRAELDDLTRQYYLLYFGPAHGEMP